MRDGPPLGIHCLIWCDTYSNVSRMLDRQSLRDFEMRVLFQMNANDSSSLMDTPEASRLGVHGRCSTTKARAGWRNSGLTACLPTSGWRGSRSSCTIARRADDYGSRSSPGGESGESDHNLLMPSMVAVPNEIVPNTRSIGIVSLVSQLLNAVVLSSAMNSRSPGMI